MKANNLSQRQNTQTTSEQSYLHNARRYMSSDYLRIVQSHWGQDLLSTDKIVAH